YCRLELGWRVRGSVPEAAASGTVTASALAEDQHLALLALDRNGRRCLTRRLRFSLRPLGGGSLRLLPAVGLLALLLRGAAGLGSPFTALLAGLSCTPRLLFGLCVAFGGFGLACSGLTSAGWRRSRAACSRCRPRRGPPACHQVGVDTCLERCPELLGRLDGSRLLFWFGVRHVH